MFLKDQASGDLVEVLNVAELFDPCKASIFGRFHAGEEMPDPSDFPKSQLIFPSGEALPKCWVDSHYNE